MRKQVLPVDPSTRPLSHVQRSAHRHVTCMPDENCAVGACSCRHQVSRGRDASSGHPGRHVPRYDPQTSGGAAEAASRRPGGRGGSAFFVEGEGDAHKEIGLGLVGNGASAVRAALRCASCASCTAKTIAACNACHGTCRCLYCAASSSRRPCLLSPKRAVGPLGLRHSPVASCQQSFTIRFCCSPGAC